MELCVHLKPHYVPLPETGTVCGLPPPSSVMLTAALRAPFAVGRNLTTIEHAPPGAIGERQLLLWKKSPGLLPVSAALCHCLAAYGAHWKAAGSWPGGLERVGYGPRQPRVATPITARSRNSTFAHSSCQVCVHSSCIRCVTHS